MSLQSWLDSHWLRTHRSSMEEVERLLAIADRDIEQSQVAGLGSEWRFDIAYNAILQSATAALAAAGYLAERQNKHVRVLGSLQFTIGLERASVDVLDVFRRKRHVAVYEQVGAVSDQEAGEALALARRIRREVEQMIAAEHPELLRRAGSKKKKRRS